MINTSEKLTPLIKTISPELNTYLLCQLIEEYISDNSLPSFHQGDIVSGLHVSHDLHKHTQNLSKYINKNTESPFNFDVKQGYFIDHNIDLHFWLQENHIIIDIGIKKFKNFPQLEESLLVNFAEHTYFICDNPNDAIHQYYIEDIG